MMNNDPTVIIEQPSLIPEKLRVISGSGLKLLALVCMLIDHTASVLLRKSGIVLFRVGQQQILLYTAMRAVGRIAFPIYAFLLVEGFLHTRDRRRYALQLFLFALVSELPWNLEHSGTWRYATQNVFFTLFLGVLALAAAEKLLLSQSERLRYSGALLGLLLISAVFNADYGSRGLTFILMLYLLRGAPLFRAVIGSCFLNSGFRAGVAFLPIALYSGRRGFIHGPAAKFLFYAAYPVHMLLLFWIKVRTIGY